MKTSIVLAVAYWQYNKRLLWVLTFFEQLLTFVQEESQTVKDERKDHGTVDESSSEQQIRESANYIWIVRKNWSLRPSATGSYGRQADEIILELEIFKIL